MAEPAPAAVHVLSVHLQHVRPPVRRRLEVPSTFTLAELSDVLLATFEWDGDHLHQFRIGARSYLPSPALGGPLSDGLPQERAILNRALTRAGEKATWTYDLGDCWEHRIEVTALQPADPDAVYPRCVDGTGLPPQEDTGEPRRGTFDQARQRRIERALRPFAISGRQLAARDPDPDEVFAGLFPEIDADAACDCVECAEAGDPQGGRGLPALRPQSAQALATTAARTELARQAIALARWLDGGRAVTNNGVLAPADAQQAISTLGLTADAAPRRGRRPSAKHHPQLHALWCAAQAAQFVELRGRRAHPGPGLAKWLEDDAPQRRLAAWDRLLAGYLAAMVEAERDRGDWRDEPDDALWPMSVMLLYTADREAALSPGTLSLGGLLASEFDGSDELAALTLVWDLPQQARAWVQVLAGWAVAGVTVEADAEQRAANLANLDELGAELSGLAAQLDASARPVLEQLGASLKLGPHVVVTPFGRYVLARLLRGSGVAVPTVGDLAGTSPGELLSALAGRDVNDLDEEIRLWLQARDAAWRGAVEEAVAAAAVKDGDGPPRRAVLPALVAAVCGREGAEPLLRHWADDPWLASAVAIGRHVAGTGPQPSPEHLLWVAVDTLTLALDDEDELEDVIDSLALPRILATPEGIGLAARVDHPDAREVFTAVAEHLEDQTLARRLRRAVRH